MFYIPEKELQQEMARSDTEISCSEIFKQSQPMFLKVIQYGYETHQNVAPILHCVICSEMNTA